MSNICNLCDMKARHLTAAGLCPSCSDRLSTGARSELLAGSFAPAVGRTITATSGWPGPRPGETVGAGLKPGYYVLAIFLMLIGVCFVSTAVFDASERGPSRATTKRHKSFDKLMESTLGARGGEAFLGVIVVACAAGMGWSSMLQASRRTRIVAWSGLVGTGLAIFGCWWSITWVL
jgi:hypothetical protein